MNPRRFLTWLVCAAVVVLTAGCGGSTAPEDNSRSLGIFSGSAHGGTLNLDMTEGRGPVSGTALLIIGDNTYSGAIAGTLTNGQLSITVDYNNNFGPVTYSGALSGSTFSGTFQSAGQSGTFSLTQESVQQSVNVAGSWTGTFSSQATPALAGSLSVTLTQNGDNLSGTLVSQVGSNPPTTGTITSGVIVGTTITSGAFSDSNGNTGEFHGEVNATGDTFQGAYRTLRDGTLKDFGTYTLRR